MRRLSNALFVVLSLGVVTAALFVWYFRRAEPTVVQPAATMQPAPPASVEPVKATAAPVEHPIEAVAAEVASQAQITADGVEDALIALLGRKAVLSTFQLDDFARRVAATVDNLARTQASSRLWPVNPAPERFLVRTKGTVTTIDPDNGLRYTAFVLLTETLDLRQVAAIYRRMYPLLQDAYVNLGYPGRQFNDRVVAVIDDLLTTPEPTEPLQVQLPQFGKDVQPSRPWVLYQFVDPELEALSAGQKILLRTGPVNERRLKSRLSELRGLLAAPAPSMR